jgi:UMP-CMP kinase
MPAIIDKVKELLHLNKTVFDDEKVTVVFVLGGPGVGERTRFNCSMHARSYTRST